MTCIYVYILYFIMLYVYYNIVLYFILYYIMSHIFLQVSLMLVTFLRFWIDGAPVEREEAQFGSTWSWHM